MSFLLPDEDDDNPFANAVSPFASYTPPPPPPASNTPQHDPDVGAPPSSTDYGQPLPTPSVEEVGHTTGPYAQVLQDEDRSEEGQATLTLPTEEARPPSPLAPSSAAFDQPEPVSVNAMSPPSPDAFGGGFQTSPDRTKAFSLYRPPSPPSLASAPREYTSPLSSGPVSPPKADKKAIEASLADLLGESEEVRLKGAFKKGGSAAGTPIKGPAGAGDKKSSDSPKKGGESKGKDVKVDEEEDPFGSLVKRRKPAKAATPAPVPAPTTQAQPVQSAPSQTTPSQPPAADTPSASQVEVAAPLEPIPDVESSQTLAPEDLPLPPSQPPTQPSTPQPPPTPPPKSPTLPASDFDPSSTSTTQTSPGVGVSPLVTPTPPAFSHPSYNDEDDAHVPPRVERSFSELTLSGQRAAELGLEPTMDGWGGSGAAGGSWGGEEDRPKSQELEPEPTAEEDAEEYQPPATPGDLPVASVDKEFLKSTESANKMYKIHIGDPTKVGLGATAHIVYTVTTTLRVSTEYGTQSRDVAVLRRFSEFLWLFGVLSSENPGVVVPPVPDKQSFGRFADEFVETRRRDLQKFLSKTGDHPVLQLDPRFTAFLTSDRLGDEMKHARKPDGEKGYLASFTSGITGPKFIERDEWFDDKKATLETLEGQLKALVKSVELVSKQRLDLAASIHDFSESISQLAQCDLSRPMSLALERFSDVTRKMKEKEEGNGRGDVNSFMGTADEYIRLVASVRLAFASRIKSYLSWQNLEVEARRLSTALDKARRAGKVAAERVGQEIALVADAERRAKEAGNEYESVTRLIKNEYGRFENERVEDFKKMLEVYVEGMIHRQKIIISAYEEYHTSLVRLVQQSQPQPQQPKATPTRRAGSGSSANGDVRASASPETRSGAGNPFAAEEPVQQAPQAGLEGLADDNAWA